MKIQSLSVVVPAKRCINKCAPCVSRMHESEYENMITGKNLYYHLYKQDFIKRMEFARDNGCNTVMLTGDCEPLQNWEFLARFGDYNQILRKPFRTIEIQTTGNLLTDDYLFFLRHHVGVTTISLSVFSLINAQSNADIIGCKQFSIYDLCERIKKYRFNLRLSLNMSRNQPWEPAVIFHEARLLKADQITFRKLYHDGSDSDQTKWVKQYDIHEEFWDELDTYIKCNGTLEDRLEYGRDKYNVNGIGTVVDNDCMSKEAGEVAKYLILRENCKLYSKWDTPGSLIL